LAPLNFVDIITSCKAFLLINGIQLFGGYRMEQISLQPAREQVAAVLRKAIFTGELRIGQELTQEEIAKQLGISRMPVREAFQILQRDGLLILKSRHAIVQGLTDEDIVDHYEIRAMLEGEAAARASSNIKDFSDIILVQENVEKAAIAQDVPGYSLANESFHRAIWDASGSSRLENLLNQLWNGLPPHLPELLPEQIQKSIVEHKTIVSAICSGQPEEARKTMTSHVRRSLDDLLNHRKNLEEI
jgi:DNA-binding GntR family transcriptional regulator